MIILLNLFTALGSCGPNGFRCHNGDCISQDLVCNNQYDCRDASDETHEACELSVYTKTRLKTMYKSRQGYKH